VGVQLGAARLDEAAVRIFVALAGCAEQLCVGHHAHATGP
jgi:hypothetical protein